MGKKTLKIPTKALVRGFAVTHNRGMRQPTATQAIATYLQKLKSSPEVNAPTAKVLVGCLNLTWKDLESR
jgi:hypothetical protein